MDVTTSTVLFNSASISSPSSPGPSRTLAASDLKPQPSQAAEKIASHPFDDRSADVILRSSDKVHFYVYKAILSFASGFFRDLFSLSQMPTEDTPSTPIIDIAEHSITLQGVLLWCYPVPHSEPGDLATVRSILTVSVKYDMTGVISHMLRPLRDLRTVYPAEVFAVSCTHYFSDIAADAADVLRGRLGNLISNQDTEWYDTIPHKMYTIQLSSIRAASFLRLLRFVRSGTKPADFCRPSEGEATTPLEIYWPIQIDYPDGDLIVRSQLDPSIHFRVHRQIVSFSSPVLKSMIQLDCIRDTSFAEDSDPPPILELPEGSTILGLLLTSCYPSDGFDSSSFDPSDIPLLAEAAKRYKVHRAILFCQERLAELTFTHPFRAYYLAIKCDWRAEARDAAVQLARLTKEEEYHPSMENLDAELYFPLLKFCHDYRKILSSIRTKFTNRRIDYNTMPTISQAFTQCKDMWSGGGYGYSHDTACVLSLITPNGSERVGPVEHLEHVHKEITERLAALQIQWSIDLRSRNKAIVDQGEATRSLGHGRSASSKMQQPSRLMKGGRGGKKEKL